MPRWLALATPTTTPRKIKMPLRRVPGHRWLRCCCCCCCCCTPRDPILSTQTFSFTPRDPILSTQTFSFTPRNPILSTQTFSFNPRNPILSTQTFSRNQATKHSEPNPWQSLSSREALYLTQSRLGQIANPIQYSRIVSSDFQVEKKTRKKHAKNVLSVYRWATKMLQKSYIFHAKWSMGFHNKCKIFTTVAI